MVTIRVSVATWERLQELASPFRGSELGTPDKVIRFLLDEYECHQARERLGFEEPLPGKHPAEPPDPDDPESNVPGRVY